ncbi:MAG: FG-GAP-like repeat-containing protein [Gemmatimonadetes bacterium]|nr:FG-GAP-like repeat-containing protein [Gemmatimonadota bacterium]
MTPVRLIMAIGLAVAGTTACRDVGSDPATLLSIQAVGLAHLEENRLDQAAAEFERLVDLAPDEAAGFANLGLAYLRMGRLREAETAVRRALDLEPDDPDARLVMADILLAGEREGEAREELAGALAIDPGHARTLYALASLDADSSRPEAVSRRASTLGDLVERQPGNVAARIEHIEALLVVDNPDSAAAGLEMLRQIVPVFPVEGQDLFDSALQAARVSDASGALDAVLPFHNVMRTTPVYQRGLRDLAGPGGVLAGFPVVTFSEAMGGNERDAESVLASLRFTDVTGSAGIPGGRTQDAAGTLSVVDFDGDGDTDIYAGGRLLRNDPAGFNDVTDEAGLSGTAPDAAAFGDFDNDGALDLYVADEERGALLRNLGNGSFADVTASLGLALPPGAPLFIDYDHDGDLDLVLAGAGGTAMLRNNLDGTFTDITALAGIEQATADGGSAAFGDFDDDDDLDFVFADPGEALRLYDNERGGRFVERAAERGLAVAGHGIVSVGDYNNDGLLDLLSAARGGAGVALWLNQGRGQFAADERPEALLDGTAGVTVRDGVFVDFDNDGWLDIALAVDNTGGDGALALFRNAAAGRFDDVSQIAPPLPPVHRIAAADFGTDGDLDLFASTADGSVRLLRNDGGNANRYLKIRLVGLSTGSGKNNHFGIGAKVEVRAGALYRTVVVDRPDVHVGLGQRPGADVIRVRWPNGVPQNILYSGANQSIVEEQILKGSCPTLFAWNGARFEFVTDILWKSALGMPTGLMARGDAQYAPAEASREYLRIPGDALRERDGSYELRVTDELWEIFYVDEIDLIAVDHPDSVDVFVDERFVPPGPEVRLELHQVGERQRPRSATDHLGRDALKALAATDDVYVGDFKPLRYQGISELHDLVFDLGDFPPGQPVRLYLRGWIFPTDASINVAVSQSQAIGTVMPHLQVIGKDGTWETAVPALSFPSGKNKTIVQDLTGLFPGSDHRVRIRTNMNIYWDEAFFTVGATEAPTRMTVLDPASAHLRYRGFSREFRKGGRQGPPWFDYGSVSEDPRWRPLAGTFTRFGDVLPLMREADDRYAIMGPGDELALRFDAAGLPGLPEGWTRDFLIYSEGWLKDSDLNTAAGWKVDPLPFHGMTRYPYASDEAYPLPEVVETWHTRVHPPALEPGEEGATER